jgi:D-alanyl-D-alanine carboxypeptidase
VVTWSRAIAACSVVQLVSAAGCRRTEAIAGRAPLPAETHARAAFVGPSTAAPPAVGIALPQPTAATAVAAGTANARPKSPFGVASAVARYTCPAVLAGGAFRSFLADSDTKVTLVDGDDALAIVNRSPTGALSPSYAPPDLVDLKDASPRAVAECESAHACLRREAREALVEMLDQMRIDGVPGRVESAFRGFVTQCWVFAGWAQQATGGFCEAAAQSALPGHSQHQLGTTVDLFTTEWVARGNAFRNGFGCTPGGRWLDENAWRFGFVVSYPIHPDDRDNGSRCRTRRDHPVPIDPKTGYKNEPWHLRFLGKEAAHHFHDDWIASGPDTPREATLEQWLRRRRGLVGDAELPVCDGCQCGACATFAPDDERTPCKDESLRLDEDGRPKPPAEEPRIVDAALSDRAEGIVVVDVKVHSPAHTVTQTPVTRDDSPTYAPDATFESLVPYPGTQPHPYEDLPGAWRIAIEPVPASASSAWPWRASLARSELAGTWNRANLLLPAKAGDSTVRIRLALPGNGTEHLRVTLLRDGIEHDTRELAVLRRTAQ